MSTPTLDDAVKFLLAEADRLDELGTYGEDADYLRALVQRMIEELA